MNRILIVILFVSLISACSRAESPVVDPSLTASFPAPQVYTTTSPRTPTTTTRVLISGSATETPLPDINLGRTASLGSEINQFEYLTWLEKAVDSGVRILRHNGILWSEIETQPGQRNWDALAGLEESLTYTSSNDVAVILIVRSTPDWAQKVPGFACGPVAEEYFPAFAAFMQDLVARYSQSPYNVKYFELGNEPDVGVGVVSGNMQYGCWGDPNDANFGGGYYAEMLKVVYPAIKEANPEAQVLIGGLLLDCDPANPLEGRTCQEANFLEGILANGGGDYFDVVSFHGYPFFTANGIQDETNRNWGARGGVVLGKINFLVEVLQKYGVEKPLFLTETALLCPEWSSVCNPPGDAFYTAQAQYVARLYLNVWANGVTGTIWYPFDGPGWRYSGLAGPLDAPKPSLAAFQYLTEQLGQAEFLETVQSDGEFVVYRFSRGDEQVWSVWTPDWQARAYTLPEGVTRITDVFGNLVEFNPGSELEIDGVHYLFFGPE